MRRLLVLASLLLWSAAAPAQSAPQTLANRVDAYLEPYLAGNNFSGTVLVAQRGKVLLAKGYGLANRELNVPNTRQTKFQIASISKAFTAACVLMLVEQKKLALEDPVARFLPDYPRGKEITLQHLLTHTSGIPNINDFPEYNQLSRFPQTPASLVAAFQDKP